ADVRERLLVVALPVAAVNEGQGRGAGRAARIDVQPLARPDAVGHVDLPAVTLAKRLAPNPTIGEVSLALHRPHRGAVVVGGVQRGAVHASIEHRSTPLA